MPASSRIKILAVLLAVSAGAQAAPNVPGDAPQSSVAQARSNDERDSGTARDAPGKTAADAAREARREYGGRVLSVTREDNGRQAYYRVKLLDNGHVRVVRISAD